MQELIKNDNFGLNPDVSAALANRLASAPNYSAEEINEVSSTAINLTKNIKDIDEKSFERLRSLAKLSQTELKPSSISSHRKIIGPIIVTIKKLVWPFIHAQLKDSFNSNKEFNAMMLEEHLIRLNQQAKKSA